MYKCTLKKVSRPNVPGGLRTDTVEGVTDQVPIVGCQFRMLADSLASSGDFRIVETSRVVKVEPFTGGVVVFTVSGSKYEISIADVSCTN